jgi:DMSO/TMAO reductase YedYZ heme-binding membrane subunit
LTAHRPLAPLRRCRSRSRFRSRCRSRTAVACVAALLAGLALSVLCADVCVAAGPPPIPGSPLDAYDRHIRYDPGVHQIARLAAIAAYALMVATVLFGVALRLRFLERAVHRATFYGAHNVLALAALIFAAVHGLTFVYQPVWHIGWYELTLPFTGGVQRVPVGLGVLATELGIAVGCSIWAQRRLGYRRWLRFHQVGYAVFALAWLHVFTVHPEPRSADLVAAGIAGGALAVLLAFLIRIFPSRSRLRKGAFAAGGEVPR